MRYERNRGICECCVDGPGRGGRLAGLLLTLLTLFSLAGSGAAQSTPAGAPGPGPGDASTSRPRLHPPAPGGRVVHADVVAMDQVLFYNRLGAMDTQGRMYALRRDIEAINPVLGIAPGNVRLRPDKRPRPLVLRVNEGDILDVTFTNLLDPNGPGTVSAGCHMSGLELVDSISDDGQHIGLNDQTVGVPGETYRYRYFAAHQGQSVIYSAAAMAAGGQQTHGLFGAVIVEPKGARWYRSQVTAQELAAATVGTNPNGTPVLDYEATDRQGLPIFNMLGPGDEIVHSDLTAIITGFQEDCSNAPPSSTCGQPFREFVIVFHDEIEAQQAFPELKQKLFKGVRDGFAMNYGTGGLGAMIFANRMKIGPAADCGECKFEEFFLESWVQGDPAMVVDTDPLTGQPIEALYPDDPSNVYHSYLGDAVRFRNLHGGSGETHVFHLHAHQWLLSSRDEKSTYMDSQSLAPGSGFTYEIQYGGSGNRNLTPGDSIFHCHLYPHFAQGMWSLWRSHDTFEAGTPDRNLPDAEIAGGTPTPAVVPVPDNGLAPMPSTDFPGYPFYLPGVPGHRIAQGPRELETDGAGQPYGGLGRHHILSSETLDGLAAIPQHYKDDPVYQRVVVQQPDPWLTAFARELDTAELQLLPEAGTPAEQAAMAFHQGAASWMSPSLPVTTRYGWPARGYRTYTSTGAKAVFLVNGLPPQPGAPFADPCPPTFVDGNGVTRATPDRLYRAAYVQFDMTVNNLGWHDRQARAIVLEDDVVPTLDGTRPAEPFFFRANSGDCITYRVTNLMPNVVNLDDFQVYTPTDTIGQHIHLVKFDVTSSDGSGNGWNYEDGTYSPDEVRERINANNKYQASIGGTQILQATEHPAFGPGPNGAWIGAQNTVQRWWADPLVDTGGADRTIRTVFTHDHFGPSTHQQHGLYAGLVIEPTDSTWTSVDGATTLGGRPDGGPTSFAANILTGLNGADSYREYMIEYDDLHPLYTASLEPLFAKSVEVISTSSGGNTMNYRSEPLDVRTAAVDSARAFSSIDHGDPDTQLFGAYPGDSMQIRVLQGAQNYQHVINLHGHRWLRQPSSPRSGYTNSQAMGISEHFEFLFQAGDGLQPTWSSTGTADYLYQATAADDLNFGMWGLLRLYRDAQPNLAVLPNNTASASRPKHPLAGGACPQGPGAPPVRSFAIEAWLARDLVGPDGIVYNAGLGLHDPAGIVFVHAGDRDAIVAGTQPLEPLVMRANAGDCLQVRLENHLPGALPVELAGSTSNVSLHPQLLSYDVGTGDGAAVGRNRDTTVPAGSARNYAWYAGQLGVDTAGAVTWTPIEFGMTNLRDMSDTQLHAQHGAIGSLVIEPAGAVYRSVDTGLPVNSGSRADILDVNGNLLFREFVLLYQDEALMYDSFGVEVDNMGRKFMKAFNYATEPIWGRLGFAWNTPKLFKAVAAADQESVLSSVIHGDPATPIFEVTRGTEVRLRLGHGGGGSGHQHSLQIFGHGWEQEPWSADAHVIAANPTSEVVGGENAIGPMTCTNINLTAGGVNRIPGDYLIRTMASDQFAGGMWALLRVKP